VKGGTLPRGQKATERTKQAPSVSSKQRRKKETFSRRRIKSHRRKKKGKDFFGISKAGKKREAQRRSARVGHKNFQDKD